MCNSSSKGYNYNLSSLVSGCLWNWFMSKAVILYPCKQILSIKLIFKRIILDAFAKSRHSRLLVMTCFTTFKYWRTTLPFMCAGKSSLASWIQFRTIVIIIPSMKTPSWSMCLLYNLAISASSTIDTISVTDYEPSLYSSNSASTIQWIKDSWISFCVFWFCLVSLFCSFNSFNHDSMSTMRLNLQHWV